MKLRLRSVESKETVKLEVPNDCNLQQLKETLILALSSSSSSSSSLHFSLNRKDELLSSSLQDSLQSLGITSGDLIYFTQKPDGLFSPSQQTQQRTFQESESFAQENAAQLNIKEPSSKEIEISEELEVIGLNCSNQETSFQDSSIKETRQGLPAVSNTQFGETLENDQGYARGDDMDVGTESADVDVKSKRISEPCFLKRVLGEEDFAVDFSDNKLLFIAIHAVFLESGFVGFDSVSGLRVDLFHLLQEQPLMNFTTSVSYTLPELLDNDNVIDSVVLKFQTLGQFVNVYGSVAKSRSLVYRSCLDKCRYVPAIGSIWITWDKSDTAYENNSYTENVVFELWKIVKDHLALPLLIDLCEKTGLVLPPCLMRLPADIKHKILESLPGIAIARMACVCKEMQYLSSSNDLWKQKYGEEFGSGTLQQEMVNWKVKFASSWENRKKRRKRSFVRPTPVNFIRSEPYRFMVPPQIGSRIIIGGDYDRLPGLGVPPPFGQPGRNLRNIVRRNISPNCNLGGFNAQAKHG
ncbi:conserved hypothetical protein [Ricinus communis]|uniref:F-box domain-containing protein n=1 Tax=Ricinus communis TaxID=3988 RepID=B9S7Z0_RICCO|nr:conserved hypothetical protein [Ricinus communis]|eukprot:XP_002522106.1 F-box protein SKIP22 [Ricinus communis]